MKTLELPMPDLPLSREQQRAADQAERQARREQEEREKSCRRSLRDAARRIKNESLIAICGIRWYSRRKVATCYWTHCHDCGQSLRYYETNEEAEANRQPCKRPSSPTTP